LIRSRKTKLVKIGGAIVSGRYLSELDGPVRGTGVEAQYLQVPVVASVQSFVDDTYRLSVSQLAPAAASVITSRLSPDQITSKLAHEPAQLVEQQTVTSKTSYQQAIDQLRAGPGLLVPAYWTVGQVSYAQRAGGALAPESAANPAAVWTSALSGTTGYVDTPIDALDTNYRLLDEPVANNSTFRSLLTLHAIGEYDPGRLPGFSAQSSRASDLLPTSGNGR
jgi:hypothetical protein